MNGVSYNIRENRRLSYENVTQTIKECSVYLAQYIGGATFLQDRDGEIQIRKFKTKNKADEIISGQKHLLARVRCHWMITFHVP